MMRRVLPLLIERQGLALHELLRLGRLCRGASLGVHDSFELLLELRVGHRLSPPGFLRDEDIAFGVVAEIVEAILRLGLAGQIAEAILELRQERQGQIIVIPDDELPAFLAREPLRRMASPSGLPDVWPAFHDIVRAIVVKRALPYKELKDLVFVSSECLETVRDQLPPLPPPRPRRAGL